MMHFWPDFRYWAVMRGQNAQKPLKTRGCLLSSLDQHATNQQNPTPMTSRTILLSMLVVSASLCGCGEEPLPECYFSGHGPPKAYTTLGKVSSSAWLEEPEGGLQKMREDAKRMGASAIVNITQTKRWDKLSNQEVIDMKADAVKWTQ